MREVARPSRLACQRHCRCVLCSFLQRPRGFMVLSIGTVCGPLLSLLADTIKHPDTECVELLRQGTRSGVRLSRCRSFVSRSLQAHHSTVPCLLAASVSSRPSRRFPTSTAYGIIATATTRSFCARCGKMPMRLHCSRSRKKTSGSAG